MTHYVIKSELWTVGLDNGNGWHPLKDFNNPEEAQAYADERNGIRPSVILESPDSTVQMLGRIANALEQIAVELKRSADIQEFTMNPIPAPPRPWKDEL